MSAKKHVFIILGFLLLAPFFLIVCEYLSLRIENVYSKKYTFMEDQSQKIETLLIGSSHPLYGVDPDCFRSRTFNASLIAQPLAYDYELLKYAVKTMPNLKRVFIPISTFSLHVENGLMGDKGPHARKYFYKHYMDIPTPEYFFNNETENYSLFKYLFIFGTVQFNGLYNYYIGDEKSPPITEKGFLGAEKVASLEELKKSARASVKRHVISQFNKNFPALPYLNKSLELLEEHNIEAILYTMPAHEEYIKLYQEKDLKEYFAFINSISQKYNVPYYNYFYGNDFGFTTKYYRDADHFNTDGAKKFSKMLDALI